MKAAEVFGLQMANGKTVYTRPWRLTRHIIQRSKTGQIMHIPIRLIVILLLFVCGFGCSTQNPSSRKSDHYVAAHQGYLRLHNVEPKDIRYVLAHVAETKQWDTVSTDESGSYDPGTKDDLVRATHVYRDHDGHDIRIDWIWEKGQETLLLISADRGVRASVSTGVGVNILRHQQDLGLLAD